MWLSAALVLVGIVAVFAVLVAAVSGLRSAQRLARHSDDVLAAVARVERNTLNMELRVRGLLASGDPVFAGLYRRDRALARSAVGTLVTSVADNQGQVRRAREIGVRVEQASLHADAVVTDSRSLADDAPRRAAAVREGRRRLDRVRTAIGSLQRVEEGLRSDRRQRADHRGRQTVWLAAIGLGVIGTLLLLSTWMTRNAIMRPLRRLRAFAQRADRGDLNARVATDGPPELRTVAEAFNEMATSLQGNERLLRAAGVRDAAMLDAVFGQTPVGLAFFDHDLRFVRVNQAMCDINHRPVEEHLGRRVTELSDSEAAREIDGIMRRVLETRTPVLAHEVTSDDVADPAHELLFLASWYPVEAEDGTVLGVGAAVADLSDRRRAELQRDEALERVRWLQTATADFSAAPDRAAVADVLAHRCGALVGAERGWVSLLDETGHWLDMTATYGHTEGLAATYARFPLSADIPGAATVRDGQLRWYASTEELLAQYPDVSRTLGPGVEARGMVPIFGTGGQAMGFLHLGMPAAHELSERERADLQTLAGQAGQALERAAAYERERMTARQLQRALLPARLPEVPGLDIAVHYSPGSEGMLVGGDFYDVFALPSSTDWLAVVGDVCGKGPVAASVTALIRHTLRAEASHEADVAVLAEHLDRELHAAEAPFATAVLLRFTRAADGGFDVCLVAAGHPAPLLVAADGRREPVDASGPLLGVLERARWESVALTLHPGDALILYTDGLTELTAPHVREPEELLDALGSRDDLRASALIDTLLQSAAGAGPVTHRDDIAIIALVAASSVAGDERTGPPAALEEGGLLGKRQHAT